MGIVKGLCFFVLFATFVKADNIYDEAVRKIVNQLKANASTFANFHLFRGIGYTDTSHYKIKELEINQTILDFSKAFPVVGAKGESFGSFFVIREAEIKIPNLTIKGVVNVVEEGGIRVALPFTSTQQSREGQTRGILRLFNFFVFQDKWGQYVQSGYAIYSPEETFFNVNLHCWVRLGYAAELCHLAEEITWNLGLANVAKSFAYRVKSASLGIRLPK